MFCSRRRRCSSSGGRCRSSSRRACAPSSPPSTRVVRVRTGGGPSDFWLELARTAIIIARLSHRPAKTAADERRDAALGKLTRPIKGQRQRAAFIRAQYCTTTSRREIGSGADERASGALCVYRGCFGCCALYSARACQAGAVSGSWQSVARLLQPPTVGDIIMATSANVPD